MTHVQRELDKQGSRSHKKEIVEPVTILEAPPMFVVGIIGYTETPRGLRAVSTVWGTHIDESFKRRYHKNWYKTGEGSSKRNKVFAAPKTVESDEGKARLERIKKYSQVIRVVAHSDMSALPMSQKKAHIMEIQVNGGSTADKVTFALGLLENPVKLADVFNKDEMIDTIAVTKGRGTEGVITRWGVTRLPRKTHRGLRKVACIGAWHPARVSYSVARVGQNGYYHRTEICKKIYRLGTKGDKSSAATEYDPTEKGINPLGGFPHYGTVTNDWIMIKGSVPGCKKRPVTLRKSLHTRTSVAAKEEVTLRFIDTSSKFGKGRFQTADEKAKWFGPMKKDK